MDREPKTERGLNRKNSASSVLYTFFSVSVQNRTGLLTFGFGVIHVWLEQFFFRFLFPLGCPQLVVGRVHRITMESTTSYLRLTKYLWKMIYSLSLSTHLITHLVTQANGLKAQLLAISYSLSYNFDYLKELVLWCTTID